MPDHGRRADGVVRNALAASLALHAAVLAFAVVAEGSAPKPPKTKVYAVDIVSPPPNVAGEPPAEALSNQEPGPAASQPQPAAPADPASEPTPPAPDPQPAPPREEAPKEPAKAPEPRRTPEQPKQRPAPQPERPSTTPNRPSTTNANRPPRETPEKNRPGTNRPASGTSGQSGTGSGTNRTRGDGTSTAPATGRNPDASSPGGEGLNIHVEGDPCPVAGYCENVTRQVNRFFRPPPESGRATGEVCFRIQRDGRVTEIQTQRVRGAGAAFRLAMMEAAEAAGSRRAFGALPSAFDPQRWRWCVELSPR